MTKYNSLYVYTSTVVAAFGTFFYGYVNTLMNPLQRYIRKNVYPEITDEFSTLMTSLVPAGAAIAAFMGGGIARKIGRWRAMLATDVLEALGIVLSLIGNEYCLLFGRLICGFCIGLNTTIVPIYITEMSPVETKGITGTFTHLTTTGGILIVYLMGLGVPLGKTHDNYWYWRFMIALAFFWVIVRTLLLLTVFRHETPKYLYSLGKEEEAVQVLKKIYKPEFVPEQLDLIKKAKELENQQGKAKYSDLITPKYRRRLLIGCGLGILQQLTGVNSILYYSNELFKDPKNPLSRQPAIDTVAVGIVNFASAAIATLFAKKIGRRKLFLVGLPIQAVMLLLIPIVGWAAPHAAETATKVFIFLFILGFGFSLGCITWLYISEILPDVGVGVAVLLRWLSTVAVAQAFPYELKSIKFTWAFFIFACIAFVGTLFVFFFVKETIGKQPHEIALMYTSTIYLDSEKKEKKENALGSNTALGITQLATDSQINGEVKPLKGSEKGKDEVAETEMNVILVNAKLSSEAQGDDPEAAKMVP